MRKREPDAIGFMRSALVYFLTVSGKEWLTALGVFFSLMLQPHLPNRFEVKCGFNTMVG